MHQRDVKKEGFRSLLEGEKLEFDVAAMDDGRLHAVRVTGPGGADVQGMSRKELSSDEEEEEDTRGAGGKAAKPAADAAAKPKPYLKPAFMPRAVARPKPPVKPKPKPPAPTAPPAPPAPPAPQP